MPRYLRRRQSTRIRTILEWYLWIRSIWINTVRWIHCQGAITTVLSNTHRLTSQVTYRARILHEGPPILMASFPSLTFPGPRMPLLLKVVLNSVGQAIILLEGRKMCRIKRTTLLFNKLTILQTKTRAENISMTGWRTWSQPSQTSSPT